MKGYLKLRKDVLHILNTELPEALCYHNIIHTLDVLNVANKYIKRLKVDSYHAKLLRMGAMLHDIGFIIGRENHEEKGVVIAKELMTKHGFSKEDINIIKGLIMATKVPQSPKTKLEQIICDSDLDYLGRRDFYFKGDQLLKELNVQGTPIAVDEWYKIQISFLESHTYHTEFAKRFRQPKKEQRIQELKEKVKSGNC
ncbi:HD domain-containing protein [Aestuariibaculum suncheonense]|uniref:HD domain-containing protein n=1 Tax=Aestuariibaculum suncheonense TaxID=1028745 RepID=A0A8J6UB66_9FLAO|nr:HD domain-containing protein [Aestuariibaculum suncheonense]MBD0836038.1 HD domain-containing protein [Aestuariibaculum suncheonense]